MLDIGWTELLVIGIVLIVVVGPKDLPPMLRAFGKMTGNLRKMAGEFRSQFDEALRETEMDDVRKTIADAQKLNPTNALRDAINPLRQMGQEIRSDLEKSTKVPPKADVEAQQVVEGVIPAEQPLPAPAMSLPDTPPPMSAVTPADETARPARRKAASGTAGAKAATTATAKPKRGRPASSAKPASARKTAPAKAVSAKAKAGEPAAASSRKRAGKKAEGPKDEA